MYKRKEGDQSDENSESQASYLKEQTTPVPSSCIKSNDDFKTPLNQPRQNKNLKVMKIQEVFGKKKEGDDSIMSGIKHHESSKSYSDVRPKE